MKPALKKSCSSHFWKLSRDVRGKKKSGRRALEKQVSGAPGGKQWTCNALARQFQRGNVIFRFISHSDAMKYDSENDIFAIIHGFWTRNLWISLQFPQSKTRVLYLRLLTLLIQSKNIAHGTKITDFEAHISKSIRTSLHVAARLTHVAARLRFAFYYRFRCY